LEVLWDSAHECGNPIIGSPEEVEAAAEWPGEPGRFFEAMREGRWIDEVDDKPGVWEIHDYFDHAPEYATGRAAREAERKVEKMCEVCRSVYRSSSPKSRFCNNACRQKHFRDQSEERVTACYGSVTLRDGTPAPAPAPAPTPTSSKEEDSCSEPAKPASELKLYPTAGKPEEGQIVMTFDTVSNPKTWSLTRPKTAGGMRRFLFNWLTRAQNNGQGRDPIGNVAQQATGESTADIARAMFARRAN
jgi:hypothetical protein